MKKIVRYSIPNIFTAASLLLGFSAIITSHYGSIEQAAWMIVWCGILDVMDGLAARLLKATSPFGAEFDATPGALRPDHTFVGLRGSPTG